jgi:hypothetical protein
MTKLFWLDEFNGAEKRASNRASMSLPQATKRSPAQASQTFFDKRAQNMRDNHHTA